MNKLLEGFKKKRIRLDKLMRQAVMAGDNYKQLMRVLELLEEEKSILEDIRGEHNDARAQFAKRGGTMTQKENGDYVLRIGESYICLVLDMNMNVKWCERSWDPSDHETQKIFADYIHAMWQEPKIEELITDIEARIETMKQETSLSGASELRNIIRRDAGATIWTISGMGEGMYEEGE